MKIKYQGKTYRLKQQYQDIIAHMVALIVIMGFMCLGGLNIS